LEWSGRTPLCGTLGGEIEQIVEQFGSPHSEILATIECIDDSTRPAIDLQQIARAGDPRGVLADVLLRLAREQHDAEIERWIDRCVERITAVHQAPAYAGFDRDPTTDALPTRADIAERLARQGYALLDALTRQQETS
jgi:hypothetical protein